MITFDMSLQYDRTCTIGIICRLPELLIGANMQIPHDIILMETCLQDINQTINPQLYSEISKTTSIDFQISGYASFILYWETDTTDSTGFI